MKDELYTLRWYVKQLPDNILKLEMLELLGKLLGEGSLEEVPSPPVKEELPRPSPDKPKGEGLLRYPAAESVPGFKMKTLGKYKDGYPKGAIVHFTAGRSLKGDADAKNNVLNSSPYCFFVISNDGTVYQNFPLNEYGSHAGTSKYPGLDGKVSDELVGIEICNAGKLTPKGSKFVSWFGELYDKSLTREVDDNANQQAGVYHRYTEAQEESLTALLLWLKGNKPDVFDLNFVLGHDEVSLSGKNDPGGALSMTMPEYRKILLELYEQTK